MTVVGHGPPSRSTETSDRCASINDVQIGTLPEGRRAGSAAGSASAVEASAFEIDRSFQILFMIIIGGLGSILGSFIGTAFLFLLLILVDNSPRLVGLDLPVNLVTNLQTTIFGAQIVFVLIVEPNCLAWLWAIGKDKLRLWPFPH